MTAQKFKINSKYFFYSLGFILFCVLCGALLWLSPRGYFRNLGKPVPIEDVTYLCERLNIEEEPICYSTEKVYPSDFSDFIKEKFETPTTTYQDFQHVFSQYQISLRVDKEPVVIVALYDINRDGNYDLMPFFDGTLEDNVIRFVVTREDLQH
ncbi:MAG: hypothetical protein J0L96_03065 [Anaerolineae bacterium]|nr:hypothetical protein [Anaerolineae bacterium]